MKEFIDKVKFWSPLLLQYLIMFAAIGLSMWSIYEITAVTISNLLLG